MLENGVSIRNKTLFILQSPFLPDFLWDPQQEADNKRAYFTRKKKKDPPQALCRKTKQPF